MLSREDNELLTRAGPGTAMGSLFRRHWLPFMLAPELAPGAPPKRVKLLGECLVAFRDSEGRARLLAAARQLAHGIEPQAPYDPDCYRVRAHSGLVPRDERDFNEHEAIRRGTLAP